MKYINFFLSIWFLLLLLVIFMTSSTAYCATLTATWVDTSNNEDGFQMERKCGSEVVFQNTGNPVSANVTTAQYQQNDNTICTYRLVAFNIVGKSLPSNEVTVNTTTIPNPPGNLNIGPLTTSQSVQEAKDNIVGLLNKAVERQH